jgi:hypothetical protein
MPGKPVPQSAQDITLLPDAGPLITLAYAQELDVLFKPGWRVAVVDMVLYEVIRSQTPTSEKLAAWAAQPAVQIIPTQTLAAHLQTPRNKAHLGEQAIQETLNQFALREPPQSAVLLFEDHAIARNSFFVPPGCQKVSTRAFLIFLEQKGWIESASAIERAAVQAGRQFSQLRFPPV